MPDIERGAERIEALETRAAFQDRTLEDLNAALTDLWKEVADLRRQILRLEGRMGAAEGTLLEVAPPEPPPPHY